MQVDQETINQLERKKVWDFGKFSDVGQCEVYSSFVFWEVTLKIDKTNGNMCKNVNAAKTLFFLLIVLWLRC